MCGFRLLKKKKNNGIKKIGTVQFSVSRKEKRVRGELIIRHLRTFRPLRDILF